MPSVTRIDLDADNEDEYEYEYSTTETESFYVHLDLSSVNGVLKSGNASDRKSLKAPRTSKPKKGKEKAPDQDADEDDQNQEQYEEREDGDEDNNTPQHENNSKQTEVDTANDSIQILELSSENPIVSYRNQIYSCTWTDMIGTNMFFTKHNETPVREPEIATEDYDLLGTTRIKLVGYKANLTAKPQADREQLNKHQTRRHGAGSGTGEGNATAATAMHDNEEGEDGDELRPPSQSFQLPDQIPPNYGQSTRKRNDAQARSYMKRQAAFLDKLKDVKRARGERDKVRTFIDQNTLATAQKQKEATAKMRQEIDQLNARVVRGDNEALERLQEIYSNIEEAESEDEFPG